MGVEWVAVVLTLLGFLGSLINALWARNERRAAADSAALASQVQESMAESQKAIAAALERPSVAFEVILHGRRQWLLRNIGKSTATSLRVDWPAFCVFVHDGDADVQELEPGEGLVFTSTTRLLADVRVTSMRVTCDQRPDGMQVTLPAM